MQSDYSEPMSVEAVLATLEDYARAYCAKDIDSLMSVFDKGDHISVIGTGADEFCIGQDQVKDLFIRNFNEARANLFDWHRTHTSVNDDFAVVSVTLSIHLVSEGEEMKVPVRWTVVLKRLSGHWVWLHRHSSTAASDQGEGQAYPSKS